MQKRVISLRVLCNDDWPLWRELRLGALREAPYAFGSKLSDWQGAGDTEERWRARLTDVPLNVVASLDGKPAGMIGALGADNGRTVELISMWVAPFARGRGVGDTLIQAIVSWAARQHAERLVLSVRNENKRAIALYARHGFIDAGPDPTIADGDPPERLMIRLLTQALRMTHEGA